MARYSLFVLKVPLNANQPTNQPTNCAASFAHSQGSNFPNALLISKAAVMFVKNLIIIRNSSSKKKLMLLSGLTSRKFSHNLFNFLNPLRTH